METNGLVSLRRFLFWVNAALLLVFLVILAGGVVRASGAGMGCPDWPLCYGLVVPPTDEAQLPSDYKEKYTVQGREPVFNALNTWIEYINRLLGVLAGIGVLILTVVAFFIKKKRSFFRSLSLATLILLGFQGWLGARVVGTFLEPFSVTLHMVMALVLILCLLVLRHGALVEMGKGRDKIGVTHFQSFLGILLGLALVAQFFLGIQVREISESITWDHPLVVAHYWFDDWGGVSLVHRLNAFVLGLCTLALVVSLYLGKGRQNKALMPYSWILFVIVSLEAIFGAVLQFGGFPAWAKPLHLILSMVFFAVFVDLILRILRGDTSAQGLQDPVG